MTSPETNQKSLFADNVGNARIIKTISYNQEEIIKDIIQLYCPYGIELDPTYSIGNFYKKIQKPKHKFDLEPQLPEVQKSDCRHLPLETATLRSIMFDPPFVIGVPNGSKDNEGSNIITNRFSSFKTLQDLWSFYYESLQEFKRLLRPNGILIFKCQDTVSSAKQCLSHVEIINFALSIGFYPLDLFVLLARNRLIGPDQWDQEHARKFHSYFIVFQRVKSPIKYTFMGNT
jgi:hypothetical protein